MTAAALQREAQRQQLLLRALRGGAQPPDIAGWLHDAPPHTARGLQVYRANASALAERALAAAFPTVVQLVGEESFAALARALWAAHPPERGDIACWGAALPGFIAAAAQLADEPYLADCARLDWAVRLAEQAADGRSAVEGLQQLAEADPAALRLRLAEGLALLCSPYPLASIRLAHRSPAADRFDSVRAALAGGHGEAALVWREGFSVRVVVLPEAEARFMRTLLDAGSLADALDRAGDSFDFAGWLAQALRQGWLKAVESRPAADA
jgi:Putative DNA-binding domain